MTRPARWLTCLHADTAYPAGSRVLETLLVPAGSITVIEGDHGSAYFHPDSATARAGDQLPGRAAGGGPAATR